MKHIFFKFFVLNITAMTLVAIRIAQFQFMYILSLRTFISYLSYTKKREQWMGKDNAADLWDDTQRAEGAGIERNME